MVPNTEAKIAPKKPKNKQFFQISISVTESSAEADNLQLANQTQGPGHQKIPNVLDTWSVLKLW